MRPIVVGRGLRPRRVFARAVVFAITTMAGVLCAAPALAQSPGAQGVVAAQIAARHLAFDHPVVVTGQLPTTESGHTLVLDFLPAGARQWSPRASTVAPASGLYRLSAPLRQSGFVRVVDGTVDPAGAVAPAVGLAAPASNLGGHVAVAARLIVAARHLSATGGGSVAVRGRLLPGWAGRAVVLQAASGNTWRRVAVARTASGGAFSLRFVPGPRSERLRVRFNGDRANATVVAAAGYASAAYRAAVASWYYDAGSTACGFHAYYGVANKSLPCGTRVTFIYGGRSVTATVDDRGPFVSGRTWDLNQNAATVLGLQAAGVATVWANY